MLRSSLAFKQSLNIHGAISISVAQVIKKGQRQRILPSDRVILASFNLVYNV